MPYLTAIALVPLLPLTAVYLVSKCFFLAPYRIGRLMMLANVVYETLFKKYHWSRWSMDAVGLLILTLGWTALAGPWTGLIALITLGGAWAWTLSLDTRRRTDELARQDRRFGLAAAPKQIPMPIPRLILNVRGPILERGTLLDLGSWPEHHEDTFDLLILNPSIVVPQWPVNVVIEVVGAGLRLVPATDRSSVADLGPRSAGRPRAEVGHQEAIPGDLVSEALAKPMALHGKRAVPARSDEAGRLVYNSATTAFRGYASASIGNRLESSLKTPDSGEFVVFPFRLQAGAPDASAEVRITLTHGDQILGETMRLHRVVPENEVQVKDACIKRWKGGARAGFGWRGDQDLYDPSTFQSVDGLSKTLELSRLFRLPSTLYLSGRLSLDADELRRFDEHFGFDRRPADIPAFIEFLKTEVTMDSELEFPFVTPHKWAMELGNHMYLHYGTHAAVDSGNNWAWRAEMGKGTYPWQSDATDSFSEQRDNARHNAEVIRDKLGVEIRSWGVPGRANDAQTGRALEAAGMVVASDCDASAWTNVMRMPPPHHPVGCEHLVEISKKYPGDCNNIYKIAMLKYWLHAARRTGRVFLYMAHHHLLMYEGMSCYQLTRAFFHDALTECKGDLYVATITALGLYWERVLCPQHKWVKVSVDGNQVTVENTGTEGLERLPLEIEMADGARFMTLVDVPAGRRVAAQ